MYLLHIMFSIHISIIASYSWDNFPFILSSISFDTQPLFAKLDLLWKSSIGALQTSQHSNNAED